MREMGFEYDPSTAGSSVRFDPPDKRDLVRLANISCGYDDEPCFFFPLDSPLLSTSVRLVFLFKVIF